jgi:flagellar protein FlgJ
MSDFGGGLIPNPVFETSTLALQNAGPSLQPGAKNATRETAEDFEAFFLSQVFAQMFEGLDVDPVFGGGQGETMFRSLMNEEYGKALAKNGGVGIADAVMRELIAQQEDK